MYDMRDLVPWSLVYGEQNKQHANALVSLNSHRNSKFSNSKIRIMAMHFMKDIIGGNVKYPCYDAEVIWIMLNTLTVNDVDEIVHDHLDIVRKSGFSFPEYESNIIQRGEKEKMHIRKHRGHI
jgi:hypothetical protein